MLTLDSLISAVTVYRQGAVITRQARLVQPEQGWPQQLRLGGLPLSLADQSLRVRLSFPQGGGGLLATDLRLELDWQEPEPQPGPDLERVKPMQAEQRRLRCLLENLLQDLGRIESLAPAAPAQRPGEPPAPYALQPRRALVQMRQKLLNQGLLRRRQLTEQIESLGKRIQEASTPPPATPPAPLYKAVVVTLRQAAETHCPEICLNLSYEQAGARWSPSYTLRFDRDFTLAEVSMRAHLCQSTGEDWRGVRLEVSTAEVAAWKEVPELASRRIGRQQSSPVRPGWRPAPPNTDTLFADFDRSPGRRPSPPVLPPEPEVPEPLEQQFALSQEGGVMRDISHAPSGRAGLTARPAKKAEMQDREMSDSRVMARLEAPASAVFLRSQIVPPAGGGGGSDRAKGSAWQPLQPVSPPEPTSEQLAYGLLHMPGGREPGRGHLQPRTPLQACLQLWRERFPKPPFDARRRIEQALQESRRALQILAPPLHSFPFSLDGFDYLYTGESLIDLPSDAQFHSVPLLHRQLSALLLWLVVPKVTCDVFRQASLESMPDLAIPSGPVDVYVGADFLASTQLPNVAPGGKFTLGLGVDQSLKVVRNTAYKETTTGMMGSTSSLRHEITVEAANQLAREVRLEVQETLPQTGENSSDIKMKVESCEPNWEPISEKPGVYRWILRIPAGESRRVALAYTIEVPAKLELVGGNRREK